MVVLQDVNIILTQHLRGNNGIFKITYMGISIHTYIHTLMCNGKLAQIVYIDTSSRQASQGWFSGGIPKCKYNSDTAFER